MNYLIYFILIFKDTVPVDTIFLWLFVSLFFKFYSWGSIPYLIRSLFVTNFQEIHLLPRMDHNLIFLPKNKFCVLLESNFKSSDVTRGLLASSTPIEVGIVGGIGILAWPTTVSLGSSRTVSFLQFSMASGHQRSQEWAAKPSVASRQACTLRTTGFVHDPPA